MHPCTTFVNGTSPFARLGAMPSQPEPAMQKPTKAEKTKRVIEDYSTPYKPPEPDASPVQPPKLAAIAAATKKPNAPAAFIDPNSLQITDDPMPAGRAAPVNKYFATFDLMKFGQAVRCATGDVGKVSGALRKYITVKNKKATIKTMSRYDGDAGYGRVWMLAAHGKALKVAA
jgi:hypothetical protein